MNRRLLTLAIKIEENENTRDKVMERLESEKYTDETDTLGITLSIYTFNNTELGVKTTLTSTMNISRTSDDLDVAFSMTSLPRERISEMINNFYKIVSDFNGTAITLGFKGYRDILESCKSIVECDYFQEISTDRFKSKEGLIIDLEEQTLTCESNDVIPIDNLYATFMNYIDKYKLI